MAKYNGSHPTPDHYDRIHPSKRRRIGGRISGRVEKYDPYKPTPTSKSNQNPTTNPPHTSNPSRPSHTKHDRKTNRSSRIHSLRRLLARDSLPPQLQIDKERELASLLFDQQKDKIARDTKQMIQRYHKVRFFERRKAERRLKKLVKERDAWVTAGDITHRPGIEGDPAGEQDRIKSESERQTWLTTLERQIHEASVDLKYTLYCPLNEKYISLFAEDGKRGGADTDAVGHDNKQQENKMRKIDKMKKRDQALLASEQQEDLHDLQEDRMDVVRLSERSLKPPMWFEVERIMQSQLRPRRPSGDDDAGAAAMDIDDDKTRQGAVKKQLELLREGRLTAPTKHGTRDVELATGSSRLIAEVRTGTSISSPAGKGKAEGDPEVPRPAWMDEEEHIDPQDLDSTSEDDDDEDGEMRLGVADDSDGSESDGDGGFFER